MRKVVTTELPSPSQSLTLVQCDVTFQLNWQQVCFPFLIQRGIVDIYITEHYRLLDLDSQLFVAD